MIEQTVEELTPVVGTRPACRALGAAHATIYRRRRPPTPRAARPRPAPTRALSEAEREAVLAELHSERFVDSSPAQVWATLLDEGRVCDRRAIARKPRTGLFARSGYCAPPNPGRSKDPRSVHRAGIPNDLAEGEGFEPSKDLTALNGFRDSYAMV